MTIEDYKRQAQIIHQSAKKQREDMDQFYRQQMEIIRDWEKKQRQCAFEQVEPTPRTNHLAHVRREAHNITRAIHNRVDALELDKQEFAGIEGYQTHFEIKDEAVEFTITFKTTRNINQ